MTQPATPQAKPTDPAALQSQAKAPAAPVPEYRAGQPVPQQPQVKAPAVPSKPVAPPQAKPAAPAEAHRKNKLTSSRSNKHLATGVQQDVSRALEEHQDEAKDKPPKGYESFLILHDIAILLTVVFLNIAIWFVEQLVYHEFEFLSVSYIVSELLLLMLYGMMQDYGILDVEPSQPVRQKAFPVVEENQETVVEKDAGTEESPGETEKGHTAFSEEHIEKIARAWAAEYVLTGRECDVLCAILRDKKRKDIAAEMCVTEHTVKKHTGNIFSKLEVSSRSELFTKAETEIL